MGARREPTSAAKPSCANCAILRKYAGKVRCDACRAAAAHPPPQLQPAQWLPTRTQTRAAKQSAVSANPTSVGAPSRHGKQGALSIPRGFMQRPPTGTSEYGGLPDAMLDMCLAFAAASRADSTLSSNTSNAALADPLGDTSLEHPMRSLSQVCQRWADRIEASPSLWEAAWAGWSSTRSVPGGGPALPPSLCANRPRIARFLFADEGIRARQRWLDAMEDLAERPVTQDSPLTISARVSSWADSGSLLALSQVPLNLKELTVEGSPFVRDGALVRLTLRCQALESITLENLLSPTGTSLVALSKCPQLKTVRIVGCPRMGTMNTPHPNHIGIPPRSAECALTKLYAPLECTHLIYRWASRCPQLTHLAVGINSFDASSLTDLSFGIYDGQAPPLPRTLQMLELSDPSCWRPQGTECRHAAWRRAAESLPPPSTRSANGRSRIPLVELAFTCKEVTAEPLACDAQTSHHAQEVCWGCEADDGWSE